MRCVERWREVKAVCASYGARLVVVSKGATDEQIRALVEAGCEDFGENRPQRLRDRARLFPDASWHQIGQVQRNKAKYVAQYASWWHSAAEAEIAEEIGRRRKAPLPTLLQINTSGEPHRHGVGWDEAEEAAARLAETPGIKLVGLMGMAPLGVDPRPIFSRLRKLRDSLFGPRGELSMGMSADWRIALEEGATIVRVGSAIFAEDT